MLSMKQALEQPTKALAEFTAETRFEDLPPEVVHEAKRLILDVIGNVIGGCQTELGWIARHYLKELGGNPIATVMGGGGKTSPPLAAYANARMGSSMDADDFFMAVCHMGNPTVASALAACERVDVSGKELITSVAVGFEAGARVAISIGPPKLPELSSYRKKHDSGARRPGRISAPHFAAAAAAAKAFGFDNYHIRQTFGIVAAEAVISSTRWGDMVVLPLQKSQDMGRCAEAGIVAALLAEKGQNAHDAIFDGEGGICNIGGTDQCDVELMVKNLGDKWHFLDNTHKPWPGCRWTHYGATIFTRIINENNLKPDEIEKVLLRCHLWGTPRRFCNKNPVGMISCEFNHPHTLAMLALGIKPGPGWYAPEVMASPAVHAFRNKVDVELEEESLKCEQWYENGQMRKLPTRMEVFARGKKYDGYTEYAKGDPWTKETYITDDELKSKFRDMTFPLHIASSSWRAQMEAVMQMVFELEQLGKVTYLTKMLDE